VKDVEAEVVEPVEVAKPEPEVTGPRSRPR
jgi:hypothetical protein